MLLPSARRGNRALVINSHLRKRATSGCAPLETVQFLIECGADINIISGKNMNGVSRNETALRLAMKAKRMDVVDLLQQLGAR